MKPRISIDQGGLARCCARWTISRLELFGSVPRDDFRPESDIDVLVTCASDASWSLLDTVRIERELAELPWTDIIGMRHELIHDDFDVDPDEVWNVVERDLGPLLTVLEPLVQAPTQ